MRGTTQNGQRQRKNTAAVADLDNWPNIAVKTDLFWYRKNARRDSASGIRFGWKKDDPSCKADKSLSTFTFHEHASTIYWK